MEYQQRLEKAKSFLAERNFPAEFGIILGSGLSHFVDKLEIQHRIPYSSIPEVQVSTVMGHAGELIYAHYRGKKLAVMSGRIHGYEGNHPNEVVFLPRALVMSGVKKFIITNASGSTHKALPSGSIGLIKDHINFTGYSPLIGKETYGGPRFADMSDPYSRNIREKVLDAAKVKGIDLKEVVYLGVLGPSFETAAEVQAFYRLGADVVGMSTVWEVLSLRQMNIPVMGLSCVANYGTGVSETELTGEEVLDEMKKAAPTFSSALEIVLDKF